MLAGDFQRNLRKCNRNLRIWCGDDDKRAAGIFYVKNSEYTELCGIDKNYVPEYMEWNDNGTIRKGGWRRAIEILIKMKLIDQRIANKVFGTTFDKRKQPEAPTQEDMIQKEIDRATTANMMKMGKPVLKKDELMDLSNEISKAASKVGSKE